MRPYRKENMASVVRTVVGEAIVHRLHDPRIEPLTTVTRVEMTGDLLIAKVFLSVHGDDVVERRTLRALQHASGFVQKMLAGRLSVRHCPELRFEIDAGAKGARRTIELLDENRRREPELYESEPGSDQASTIEAEQAEEIKRGSDETSDGAME